MSLDAPRPTEAALDPLRVLAAGSGPTAGVIRPRHRPAFIAITAFFTIAPLASLLAHPPGPVPTVLLLAGWVLFGVVLLSLFRGSPFGRLEDGWWLAGAAIGMTAIAAFVQVAYGVADGGALFFYAGVTAARLVPQGRAFISIALVSVTAMASTGLAGRDWADALALGVTVAAISLTISALSALGRTNRALLAARRELADLAVRDERDRIARDLHDTLGHTLSLIALKSELARRLLPDEPERAAAEIADVERVAREGLAAVRETVSGVRRPTLAGELAGAREALAAAGIAGDVPAAPDGLPGEVDAVLGWAVREGVTNVLRHSDARTARIRVISEGGVAGIEVVDDGHGAAEPTSPLASGSSAEGGGVGLAGLQERAGLLGGGVEAGPLPERGFRLRVTVPAGGAP